MSKIEMERQTPKAIALRLVEQRVRAQEAQESMYSQGDDARNMGIFLTSYGSNSSIAERQLRGDTPTSSAYLAQHPASRRKKNSLQDKFIDSHERKYKVESGTVWNAENEMEVLCQLPPRSFGENLIGAPAVGDVIRVTDMYTQQVLQVEVLASFYKRSQKTGRVVLKKL